MADLASVDDLQKLMKRTFSGGDLEQANMVLQIVSSWARAVSGRSWLDAPTGVPADVVGVVLTASRRELSNPDRVIMRTKGPFSVTYDKPPVGFFSAGELSILKRFARKLGGLFTVSTTRGDVAPGYNDGFLTTDQLGGDPFGYYREGEPGWEDSYHFGH